ncbi:MAG TPA: hypothetical protein VLB44_03640 [Kofleriaceae bacterium]|nr:hypothetical protein [Kofleriaceae bacterium]
MASVATTAVNWRFQQDQPLPAGTLSNQTPELHYMVHGELRGPGPFKTISGLLLGDVVFAPQAWPAPDITLRIRLTSLTHPDQPPIEHVVTFLSSQFGAHQASDSFDFEAWQGCTTGPCSEDFELTIARDAALDIPAIDATGSVRLDVYGTENNAPAGTELAVEVTALP